MTKIRKGWADDTMDAASSFRDPISSDANDRNKPEVAAPGTLINTTLAAQKIGQWFDDFFLNNVDEITGTSFAAPHVTGEAALIVHRANWLGISSIRRRPEIVKAIIMASANNDIEFGIDRDGVGGISASWADDIVTGWFGGWGYATLACADTYPFQIATIPLQAGIQTRVVINWSTDPSWSNYYNKPSSDLNLRLYDPTGQLATLFGNGFNDTYEWVDINPQFNGNYTL